MPQVRNLIHPESILYGSLFPIYRCHRYPVNIHISLQCPIDFHLNCVIKYTDWEERVQSVNHSRIRNFHPLITLWNISRSLYSKACLPTPTNHPRDIVRPFLAGKMSVVMLHMLGEKFYSSSKPTLWWTTWPASNISMLKLSTLYTKHIIRYLSLGFPGLYIWMSYGTNYGKHQVNATGLQNMASLLAEQSLSPGHR